MTLLARLLELLRDLWPGAPCSRHEAFMRLAGRKRFTPERRPASSERAEATR
jgi:hypothetical protein